MIGSTWVEPAVDAEVAYSSKTDAGLLREAVFKGLREDLAAQPLRVAVPRIVSRTPSKGVPPYNILQRLPNGVAPTEEELVAYWSTVEKQALTHLARRPLKLVRRVGHTIHNHLPRSVSPDGRQLPGPAVPVDQLEVQQTANVCRLQTIRATEADLAKRRFFVWAERCEHAPHLMLPLLTLSQATPGPGKVKITLSSEVTPWRARR